VLFHIKTAQQRKIQPEPSLKKGKNEQHSGILATGCIGWFSKKALIIAMPKKTAE
jgi:hypothetical protein